MIGLDALFGKHGTDKGSLGFDGKGLGHGYHVVYESELKGVDVRAVLEIGVFDGASLRAWAEAWPAAKVWGVESSPRKIEKHPRIEVIRFDASKPGITLLVAALGTQFDLIVDDGSHEEHEQLASALLLARFIRRGGVYVIEDVLSPEIGEFLMRQFVASLGYMMIATLVELRPDSRMIVLRRAL